MVQERRREALRREPARSASTVVWPSRGLRRGSALQRRDGVRERLDRERAPLHITAMYAVVREGFAMAAELCETLWAYWSTTGYFTDVVATRA